MSSSKSTISGNKIGRVPGPFFARVAILAALWKLWQLLRGIYQVSVRRLHEHYGPFVQVSPREFTLADRNCVYMPKLIPSSLPVDIKAFKALEQNLSMSNLFRLESKIDTCNSSFISLLVHEADNASIIDMKAMLARYAYEAMLVTTTGQPAGFLEPDTDPCKIKVAMSDWKFYSVLYGSYLRYHPFISAVANFCGYSSTSSDSLFASKNSDTTDDINSGERPPDLETRIALSLAGADPAIVLIMTTMQHVFSDAELLKRLRNELAESKLQSPVTFKDLILNKPNMPVLHAVLLECARLVPPNENGLSYTASEDMHVADHQVTKGSTITLQPSITHVNPVPFGESAQTWDPEKWLDPMLSLQLKRHLLAFNYNDSSIESFQILIAAKLLIQLISEVDITITVENAVDFFVKSDSKSHSMHESDDTTSMSTAESSVTSTPTVDTASKCNTTLATLPIADRLETLLGKEAANELLTGRLAAHHVDLTKEACIISKPILNPYHRHLIHDAIEATHGKRLEHCSHPDRRMCIGPRDKIPLAFRPKKRGTRQHKPNAKSTVSNTNGKNGVSHSVVAVPRPVRETNSDWGAWTGNEEKRQIGAKSCEKQREQIDEHKIAHPEQYELKVDFQTNYVPYVKEQEQPKETKEAPEVPKPKAIPPHLRKRLVQN